MMELHGSIHRFPKEIELTILAFVTLLSIGFFGGLSFVNKTTEMKPSGIETNYLGNENDELATVMKFKKNEQEMLTIVHNHILSMSVIFFLMSLLLATTSINKKLKYFLMFEPFLSVILTFGGIYVLWKGFLWFKYIVLLSGILMTSTFAVSVLIIWHQILFSKKY
ncbi:MAG: hypothetical protein R3342_04960 [Lutibacter sp.]|uniref:hypothetical protein n=1 Tax=Lutibacter sp. TaxID=1925666 RepID=UPI00299DCA6D|nr:hypothetical protein [Lutibacter sp.]MDX1828880.1 hypothetical protein [Lutibacter sp.]